MRKLCFAAIAMFIAAGCGDTASTTPDPETPKTDESTSAAAEPIESNDSPGESETEVASAEEEAADADMPADADKPDADSKEDVAASDESAKAEPETVEAGLAAIDEEYRTKMQAFQEWYSSASDEDKRSKFQEYYPDSEAFAQRAMKLATDMPEDPAVAKALAKAATMSRGDTAKEARGILFAKHPNEDAVAEVLPMLSYETGEDTEKGIRSLLETTTNDRVKAFATLTLGQYLSRANQMKQMLADNEDMKQYYADEVEYLEAFKLDKKEVETLFTTVIENYGSVSGRRGTLGDSATAALFEIQNLQVGMPVPDIEGADLDGVEFKLSDYKGKVVLLDFWGNW